MSVQTNSIVSVIARTRDELLEHFEEQVGFLEMSNAAFDSGNHAEAKRLAVALRNLFHHTADDPRGRNHALINQLGLRDSLTWLNTAGRLDPRNLLSCCGLVTMVLANGTSGYEPKLGGPHYGRWSRIAFDPWWTDPTTKDGDGTLFSRKNFVLALCNNEGGAHIDPEVKESYHKVAKLNSIGWRYQTGDGPETPFGNPVPSAVRQISYEVLESIQQQRHRIR